MNNYLSMIFMALKRACFNESLKKEEQNKRCSDDLVYVPKKALSNFHFFSWKDLLREASRVRDPRQFSQVGYNTYKLRVVLYEIVLDVYFAYTPNDKCNFRLLRVKKVCFTKWYDQYHKAIVDAAKNDPNQFEASYHYIADRYGARKIEVQDIINGIADHCIQCTLRDGSSAKIAIDSYDFNSKYHSDGVVIIGLRKQSEVKRGEKPFVIITAYLKDSKKGTTK